MHFKFDAFMQGVFRAGMLLLAAILVIAGMTLVGSPANAQALTAMSTASATDLPRGCYQPEYDPYAPVPPLVVCDRGGTDQDELFSIGGDDVFYELPDGSGVDSEPRSVNGAASVPYTTGYYDDKGYVFDGPSYVATFNDTGVSGVDAKNGYVARVSPRCQDGLRKVDFDFVNEPDSRYRMVHEANLFIDDNLRGVFANRVLDGETVYMGSLMAGPGRRVVRMEQDNQRITGLSEFVVPRCGGGDNPDPEPPGPNPNENPMTNDPKVRIKVIRSDVARFKRVYYRMNFVMCSDRPVTVRLRSGGRVKRTVLLKSAFSRENRSDIGKRVKCLEPKRLYPFGVAGMRLHRGSVITRVLRVPIFNDMGKQIDKKDIRFGKFRVRR